MRRKRNGTGEMGCKQIRELLPLWIDRQADPEQDDAIARHLMECDECEAACREFKRLDTLVEANVRQLTVGDGFAAAVMKEVRETAIEGVAKPAEGGLANLLAAMFRPRPLRMALAAALLVLVAGAGIWFGLDMRLDESGRPVIGGEGSGRNFTGGLHLAMVEGEARVMDRTGGSWATVAGRTELRHGCRVSTGSDARLRLRNAAGTCIAFQGAVAFEIGKNSVSLSEGGGLFNVAPLDRSFTVDVPGGAVTVLGTVFSVAVDKNSPAEVILWEGKVKVATTAGGCLVLTPGNKALVEGGRLAAAEIGTGDRRVWRRLLSEIAADRVDPAVAAPEAFVPACERRGHTVEIQTTTTVERDRAVHSYRVDTDDLSGECGTLDRVFDLGGSMDHEAEGRR